MKWKSLALGVLAAAQSAASLRFVMYIDQYHTQGLPDSSGTAGITHAVMAFAASTLFNGESGQSWQPFEPVDTMRKRFSPDTKLLVAIGGWGDTKGFSEGAKTEQSRATYAKNVKKMVDQFGLDGVDIDWEYPAGNGEDYKDTPNDQKKDEIETYPLLLAAIRKELGKDKLISIATPGKRGDMIAFTKEQGPKIWESVDMVNIMTYDLMNRRNNVTSHHTSVQGSLDSVKAYEEIGLDTQKINLGVAYYAKWFETKKDAGCDTQPLGCEVAELEDAKGKDTGKSGALTFEKGTMGEPAKDLKDSTDGSCGFGKGKCPSGTCCSQYGTCGTTDAHCQAGCQSDYGTCKGISLIDSWRRAEKDGVTDEEAGGQYYFDKEVNLFWSWDTAPLIARKFKEIVDAEKLGGVMAWSLGEDTLEWEHLHAMQQGVQERS
ncbi:glycoside hydrolase superfamily [Aspergillus pseudonomiae]|uniref:chitinase n=1 Tax=Aspergillus pseudonomiae TaxID=1506151 RepID=A0A5N6I2K0_9EURO|nr:glycoside hydrolase superfamily [Aspergillus pseudonomiae]KAB8259989.1 glycoside hydrolase superfamily [Aspergillus pseudonomiae]KAE8407723.1 glycoside hydrolase superfamily [Aspergillus pseudonomiae]